MTASEQLARYLPYLRRYARILTGSQKSGDAYVRATLEAAIAGGVQLLKEMPPRLALYRLFHVIWSGTMPAQDESGGGDTPSLPDARLQALTPTDRQALLLTSVEGFTPAETAFILDTDQASVERSIVSAQQALEADLATSVLIIEDEPIIAFDLEILVKELGHSVHGTAATRSEAVAIAKDRAPGLVLSDIRLADGSSGIDAVRDILGSFDVPVIFITAYPERLLTGQRPEPTYLITKPFSHETVKATIGQALFFHRAGQRDAAA